MTDLQILSSLNVLARNNTKPEISDEKRNMECVLSKWEPPVQNERVKTYDGLQLYLAYSLLCYFICYPSI